MADRRTYVVYRQKMVPVGHGYPFWVPEVDESLPLPYRQKGVRLGDLVILNDNGGYSYLFNIEAAADDPVNLGRTPPNFVPLPMPTPASVYSSFHRKGATITACDVVARRFAIEASAEIPTFAGAGIGFGVSTSKAEEAALMLPDGGARTDISSELAYEEYAAQHIESWFEYVEGTLKRRLPTSSLFLISGCDKAASWGAAVIHNPSESHDFTINFTVGGLAGGGISYSTSSQQPTEPTMRCFPPAGVNLSPHVEKNQCLFARGLTLTIKKSLVRGKFAKIRWITGSSNDVCPSFDKSSSSGSNSSLSLPAWSPVSRPSGSGSLPGHGSSLKQASLTRYSDGEDPVISSDSDSELTLDQINDEWSWNPPTCISQRVFDECPDAKFSIVSDHEWMPYARTQLTVDDIVDKVMARRKVVVTKDIAIFTDIDLIKEITEAAKVVNPFGSRHREGNSNRLTIASEKRIAKRNKATLKQLHLGLYIPTLISLGLRLFFRWNSQSIFSIAIYIITYIPAILITGLLIRLGSPLKDPTTGTMMSYIVDLHQPGVTEWCFDVLYGIWACQVASGAFGDWVWWLYTIIPLYTVYKVWTYAISPLLHESRPRYAIPKLALDEDSPEPLVPLGDDDDVDDEYVVRPLPRWVIWLQAIMGKGND